MYTDRTPEEFSRHARSMEDRAWSAVGYDKGKFERAMAEAKTKRLTWVEALATIAGISAA